MFTFILLVLLALYILQYCYNNITSILNNKKIVYFACNMSHIDI